MWFFFHMKMHNPTLATLFSHFPWENWSHILYPLQIWMLIKVNNGYYLDQVLVWSVWLVERQSINMEILATRVHKNLYKLFQVNQLIAGNDLWKKKRSLNHREQHYVIMKILVIFKLIFFSHFQLNMIFCRFMHLST